MVDDAFDYGNYDEGGEDRLCVPFALRAFLIRKRDSKMLMLCAKTVQTLDTCACDGWFERGQETSVAQHLHFGVNPGC